MAGRQSHGRPVLAGASGKKGGKSQPNNSNKTQKSFPKSRSKSHSTALNAFALAAEELGPEKRQKGVRYRDLDEQPDKPSKKRAHDEDDEDDFDDEEDEEEEAPQRKKAKKDEFEGFSDAGAGSDDSEEWHVGVGSGDEDSELDSDEAFGESDEEKFAGYSFGGSSKKGKKNKKRGEESEGDEEDDSDLESLGSDAIDLATALDQYSSSEDEEGEGESGSEEEDDEESTDGDDESSEDDEEDEEKMSGLKKMISAFGGEDDEEDEQTQGTGKAKLSLADLGLAGIKDEHIKKSIKLMNKEEKGDKKTRLDVPLAKPLQDRNLRSAAYAKTNETLDRWIDTVKSNRRADHLIFPLAQNAQDKGLDAGELMPVNQKTSGTELENAILSIMEESGLGPSASKEKKNEGGLTDEAERLSKAEQKEIARQRRRERELHSREMVRQKRIKKIKSKAYRRIHRKELLKDEQAAHDERVEAGEIDSEEERELQDRRRAEERMGTRHRESKWAKLGKKAGRAVWDEDFRAGLTDMARRKEELRRRVEGRRGSDDEGSDVSMGSDDEGGKKKLLSELERAAAYDGDDEPKSGLMAMRFMQRGEEIRRKENDELVAQIRRELDSDAEVSEEEMDIGRRQYGMGKPTVKLPADAAKAKKKASKSSEQVIFKDDVEMTEEPSRKQAVVESEPVGSNPNAPGGWSRVSQEGRESKKAASKAPNQELDLSNAAMPATKFSKPKSKTQTAEADDGNETDDSDAIHLPMAIRDQKLINRAFAGEDVHLEFRKEKAEIAEEDDDKEIDNTLPGWGSWVGDGVSAREQRRHKGRFVTKVEGVKKTSRKDYKLKDAIVSERRVKKNDTYLATSLPHPFESQQQYERSLRLPVGPEWQTKETFQGATKPRVIIKQGLIAPMSKPMV
ncbi:Utp14 protein-domain-containing protein [Triangularia verruculosa]|uniref:Utp14 protein-domain-containing protein n=1 Tax=Triangularia verruculosa TaxID=2587418 RepID=A0AAN6XID3_9PEZI|nr:Utp14 protein-domain-containing protein [Triangularia verruculosa]